MRFFRGKIIFLRKKWDTGAVRENRPYTEQLRRDRHHKQQQCHLSFL